MSATAPGQFGFFDWFRRVVDAGHFARLTRMESAVLMVYARCAENGSAWVTFARLVQLAGGGQERRVREARKQLERLGLLRLTGQHRTRNGTIGIYTLGTGTPADSADIAPPDTVSPPDVVSGGDGMSGGDKVAGGDVASGGRGSDVSPVLSTETDSSIHSVNTGESKLTDTARQAGDGSPNPPTPCHPLTGRHPLTPCQAEEALIPNTNTPPTPKRAPRKSAKARAVLADFFADPSTASLRPLEALLRDKLDQREQGGKPMTPAAAKLMARELASQPLATARRMLEESIANDWQGVFVPRAQTVAKPAGRSQTRDDDAGDWNPGINGTSPEKIREALGPNFKWPEDHPQLLLARKAVSV